MAFYVVDNATLKADKTHHYRGRHPYFSANSSAPSHHFVESLGDHRVLRFASRRKVRRYLGEVNDADPSSRPTFDARDEHRVFEALPLIEDMPHPVDSWSTFIRRASSYEPMFRFILNDRVALWLNDVSLMRSVLKAPFSHVGLGPLIRGFETAGGLGNALTVNYGDSWRPRHKILQHPLTHKGVRALGPLLQESLRSSIAAWSPGKTFNPNPLMTSLILDALGSTLFSGDHREFVDVIHAFDVERNLAFVYISQDPAYVPSDRSEFAVALRNLDTFIYAMIAARRQAPKDDLLSRILSATTADEDTLSDLNLRDEVVGLIYAGHKTTANTLAFASCLLARYPDVQRALADEVAPIAGSMFFHEQFEDAAPLASAIITETLRMFPVGDPIDRTVVGPFALDGVQLPQGLPILFSTWIPHHAPDVFESPDSFSPARCQKGWTTAAQKDSYLPFSTGPKVCLGVHLANYEAALAMSLIVERWSLSPADRSDLHLAHDPLLYADPWPPLTLAPRQSQ